MKLSRDQQLEQRYDQLLELGEILRTEREKKQLSQSSLAAELEVYKSAISRAENGQRLSRRLLAKYNTFFGLELQPPIKITAHPQIAKSNRKRRGEKRKQYAGKPIRSRSQSLADHSDPCDREVQVA